MSLADLRRMCVSQLFILIWYDIRLACGSASDYWRMAGESLGARRNPESQVSTPEIRR
jgi:hypothetical protein